MSITDKISSIVRGSTMRLTSLLSEPLTQPFQPKFLAFFPVTQIVKMPAGALSKVTSSDLHVPFSSMTNAAADIIEQVDVVSVETHQLYMNVEGSIETIARKIDKTRFLIDSIKADIIADYENPSTIFSETFDSKNMVDVDETTATVHDGVLSSSSSASAHTYLSSPLVERSNTASRKDIAVGSKVMVSAVSVGKATAPIDGVGDCGAVIRSRHTFSAPAKVSSVKVTTDSKTKLAHVYGVEGSGTLVELTSTPEILEVSVGRSYVFALDARVLSGVICIAYSEDAQQISKDVIKQILTGTAPKDVDAGIIEQIKAIAESFKTVDGTKTTYGTGYVYSIGLQASGSYQSSMDDEHGQEFFQSRPIKVDGDVRTIKIAALETLPAGTDVAWSLSVNGSSFIPVMPENIASIQSERITFGADGTALFRFPVKAGTSYAVIEGVADNATFSDIMSGNNVVGVDVAGPHDSVGAVSYEPLVPDHIDISSFGLAPSAPSVIEARTGGELGERFVSSSGRNIVLAHRPSGSVTVYIGGTRATELTDTSVTNPELDEKRYFFQRVGRELRFNREVSNITVYYSYPVSTVTVRATLTATPSARQGPSVSSYSLSMTHV